MIDTNICGLPLNSILLMSCVDEMSGSIQDKKEYFNTLVYKRLSACNEVYIEESNKAIDRYIDSLFSDKKKQIDIRSANKAIRSINNSLKFIYGNLTKLLKTM